MTSSDRRPRITPACLIRVLCVVCGVVALNSPASAAVILAFEDFERTGSARTGVLYTSNKIGTGAMPTRAQNGSDAEDRYGSFNLTELNVGGTGVFYSNVQGSDFLSVEDQNFDGSASTLQLDWTGMNISGQSLIDVSFFVAEDTAPDGFEDWDVGDGFTIDFQIDGGGFLPLFAIQDQGAGSTAPQVDTDFNGVGDGALITDSFTQFSAQLINSGGAGSSLDLRVIFTGLSVTGEDLAFDSFQVSAVPEPSTAGILLIIGCAAGALRKRRLSETGCTTE